MRTVHRSFGPFLLVAGLALAACDSDEERAEAHFQRGMELLAAQDVDRAMIEFRNVFRLDDAHSLARLQFAGLLRERGELSEAFGQYLQLVESDPQNAEGHLRAAELGLQLQDFETAGVHADRAYALNPGDLEARALKAVIDYRRATDRPAARRMAEEVLAEDPGSVTAQMVVIADMLAAEAPAEALVQIDEAIAAAPGSQELHLARVATLEMLGDVAGAGDELRRMVQLFPENPALPNALVRWYLAQGDTAGAETQLRDIAARSPADPELALAVVRFVYELRGSTEARAELETLVAAASDPRQYQRALAGLDFAEGRTAEALTTIRGLLASATDSHETLELQATLAEILAQTGEITESAALIETILAADGAHVGALKLRAKIAIDADRPEAAIQDMRSALTQAPRDAEIMTIMALAHEREGSRELAGERLALAVEISQQAPAESVRYAQFLMRDGKTGPAEGVVVDALRRAPENPKLLSMLGEIHISRRDWARSEQVAAILRRQGDPESARIAAGLEMASLRGQGRLAETIERLQEAGGADGDSRALAALVAAQVEAGDLEAAQANLDEVLAADPDSTHGRLLLAGLQVARGATAEAEASYRAVIADAPELAQGHRLLAMLLARQGRPSEALEALDAGLTALPGDGALLFARASHLEAVGDIDGAIETYEELYARDTNATLIANNLASLLSTYRNDPESVERAFVIARRLRHTDVPHFQDTYGWILYLRGDLAQALEFLEQAGQALPDNALVQFHLGEAQFALDHRAAARETFVRAVDLAGTGTVSPMVDTARARIAEIDATPGTDG